MASPIVNISKQIPFADGSAAFDMQVSGIVAIGWQHHLQFAPPPKGQELVGNLKAGLNMTSPDLKFSGGTVTFKGGADGFAQMYAFSDLAAVTEGLQSAEPSFPELVDLSGGGLGYLLIAAGYDLSATASGSIPLGAGATVTFGADGKTNRLFAVAYRVPSVSNEAPTNWEQAIEQTAGAWMMPSQVTAQNSLHDGSWIVTEVEGSFTGNLGVTYGYDFSFMRKLNSGALKGDIGLRLQLGISAALSFTTSGQCIVVLSRSDQNNKIRLQLFKQPKLGWDFAFNAGMDATASVPAPADLNDLVGAVLGTDASQILAQLDKWTAPNADLSSLFTGATVDYVNKLLTKVTAQSDSAVALTTLRGFLDTWKQLPQSLSSLIYRFAEQEVPLDELRTALQSVQNASTQDGMQKLVDSEFNKSPIANSVFFKWLEAASAGPIAKLIADQNVVQQVNKLAQRSLAIIDGSALQNVLTELQQYISSTFRLDAIDAFVQSNGQKPLDDWLRSRIAAFLDKPPASVVLDDLKNVQSAIRDLKSKIAGWYGDSVKALKQTYHAKLTATYQYARTDQALVDAEFIINDEGMALLTKVLSGDLTPVFGTPSNAVTVHHGALTHGIQRHAHLELTLPYFDQTWDHINNAVAGVYTDDGKLLTYKLDAQDETEVKRQARFRRDSQLSLSGVWKQASVPDLNVHVEPGTLAMSYILTFDSTDAKGTDLISQLQPEFDAYFKQEGRQLQQWIAGLDQAAQSQQSNRLGQIALQFKTLVSGDVLNAWSSDVDQSTYQKLSMEIQRRLKALLPFYYFQDPSKNRDRFLGLSVAIPALVYAALPPMAEFEKTAAGVPVPKWGGDVYWEPTDDGGSVYTAQLTRMFNSSEFLANFTALQANISMKLANSTHPKDADYYSLNAVGKNLALVVDLINPNFNPQSRSLLMTLLGWEKELIESVVKAAKTLAQLQRALQSGAKPTASQLSQSLDEMQSFGSQITNALNKDFENLYTGDALQPLGPLFFASGAQVLSGSTQEAQTISVLDVALLKSTAPLPVGNDMPPTSDVVLRQTITSSQ